MRKYRKAERIVVGFMIIAIIKIIYEFIKYVILKLVNYIKQYYYERKYNSMSINDLKDLEEIELIPYIKALDKIQHKNYLLHGKNRKDLGSKIQIKRLI